MGNVEYVPLVAQSHQLVGEYHGAPSVMQLGVGVVLVARLVEDDLLIFEAEVVLIWLEEGVLAVVIFEPLVGLSGPNPDPVSRVFRSVPGVREKVRDVNGHPDGDSLLDSTVVALALFDIATDDTDPVTVPDPVSRALKSVPGVNEKV